MASDKQKKRKSDWWLWLCLGAVITLAVIYHSAFAPIKQPLKDFFNSNFSTAFFGAVGGALTIMFIEGYRQKIRLLADINVSIGVMGHLINTLLNTKKQFTLPLVMHYKEDVDKFNALIVASRIVPNPPNPVVVSFKPYLKRYYCPLLTLNAPLETIFSQAHRIPAIVPIVSQAKSSLKEVEGACSLWNQLIENMQKMNEDDRNKLYFGQAIESKVVDTIFPDTVKCLELYTDDALFFLDRSIDSLMSMGNLALPFWLKRRICRGIIIDDIHKVLMPPENHLEGWQIE